ncbi:MAG: pyridoxamine 5'-phosphate oxidase [Ilumatobacter sp.]|uniref:pyridoxamine 5'-phosphate oxidase n=1 Tax=Ilumatobacter sp. TaxID=1967498 RepID=UPI00391C47AA
MSDIIRERRVQYETAGLDVDALDPDPMTQWRRWHDEAHDAGLAEPNAMTLGTIGLDGAPDARIVLVRGADAAGFSFFTNYRSAKSRQLDAHPYASAVFGWLDLHRQVRVRGSVERASTAESDAYFASRPRTSRLGAWASPQSEVLASRDELEERVIVADEEFADLDVGRPDFWGGWRLVPTEFEFWQGRPSRLHDRLRYRRSDSTGASAAAAWIIERLAP